MLTFVQSLQTYTMVEVLEPHWHEFHALLATVRASTKLRPPGAGRCGTALTLPRDALDAPGPDDSQATTVDQVLDWHRDMLDSCLKECMLSNAKLLVVLGAALSNSGRHPRRFLTKLAVVCTEAAGWSGTRS